MPDINHSSIGNRALLRPLNIEGFWWDYSLCPGYFREGVRCRRRIRDASVFGLKRLACSHAMQNLSKPLIYLVELRGIEPLTS